MRIGFTGTREGMTEKQRTAFRMLISTCGATEFHHGDCKGADDEAATDACLFVNPGLLIFCYPGPEGDPWRANNPHADMTMPPKTHFARNRDIVNATDRLIATPKDMTPQTRGGTWYTIGYARKVGKPVTIIWPDGSID